MLKGARLDSGARWSFNVCDVVMNCPVVFISKLATFLKSCRDKASTRVFSPMGINVKLSRKKRSVCSGPIVGPHMEFLLTASTTASL